LPQLGAGSPSLRLSFLLLARRPRKLPFKVVIDNTGSQRKRPPISQ